MSSKPEISIVFPTRKRTELVIKSVASLLHYAKDTSRIEFLIAYDDDDTESHEFFQTDWIDFLAQTHATSQIFKTPRYGYLKLHEYVNMLATHARGNWICAWNDDCYMLTQDWDQIIVNQADYFGLLRMPCTNMNHPFALMPIVPRHWVEHFGKVSPVNHVDWWVYQVSVANNAMKNIPVQIYHDRADITGNNNDETYKNRSYAHDGRDSNNPEDYSHPDRQSDLRNWIEKFHLHGQPA